MFCDKPADEGWGLCRRYPPELVQERFYEHRDGGYSIAREAAWPEVDSHEWCGEFKARPK
jgi:hypothetical protein